MSLIKRINILTFFSIVLSVFGQQNKYRIFISNENKSGIANAKVEVLTEGNKHIFVGTTNNTGEVSFYYNSTNEIDKFRVNVQHSNFSAYNNLIDFAVGKQIAIVLKDKVIALDEVVINSKLKQISIKGDKLIMAVNGSKELGSNVIDIIQNAPGIIIDKDEISFLGKDVLVEMDGKRVIFSNQQLLNFLKSQKAQSIKSIELIQNPGSKYAADFDGRVINIIKLRDDEGFNASFDGSFTQRSKHPSNWGALDFNYFKKNMKIYGGAGYTNAESTEIKEISQAIDANTRNDRNNESNILSKTPQYNWGIDYYLSKRSVIGINGQLTNIRRTNITNGYSEVFTNNNLDSLNLLTNTFKERVKTYNINLNFKTELDTIGTTFNFDFDIGKQDNKYSTNQYSKALIDDYESSYSDIIQLTNSKNQLFGLKADLRGKLGNISYATGLHFNNSVTKHSLNELLSNSGRDSQTEGYLNYDEKIYAGYIEINGKKNDFSYSAGLRAETTDYKGYSNQDNTNISDIYTRLFPQFSISQKINKNHYLSLSYRRRIKRPRFSELIPFKRYTDVYSYSTGNPNLIAFYPNIAEVYYSYKNSLWSNISYESAKSKITDYYSLLSDSITTLSTKANIGEYQKIKFAIGYNKKITNWLNYRSSFSYTTGYESITFPDLNQNRFNYNAYTLWLSPLIKLADFTVTPNFYYSSDVHYSATKTLNYWYLDFDIRYSFNDNLEFSFVARDIFLTGITRNISKYQNIDIRLRNNWDSRLFTVGFSYFFGNDKVKSRKREPSANKDNLNRL